MLFLLEKGHESSELRSRRTSMLTILRELRGEAESDSLEA
jgi:hypothetical protein